MNRFEPLKQADGQELSLEERLVETWLGPGNGPESSIVSKLRKETTGIILGSISVSQEIATNTDPNHLTSVYDKHKPDILYYKNVAELSKYLSAPDWRKEDELKFDHQEDAMTDTLRHLAAGHKHGYVEVATSGGKTYLISKLTDAFVKTGSRVLILAPTNTIADQTGNDPERGLRRFAEPVAQNLTALHFGGSKAGRHDQVVVSTYAALNKFAKTGELGEFDVVLADEAHRGLGELTSQNIKDFSPNAIKIGFTATPNYAVNKKVEQIMPKAFHRFNVRRAIEEGVVSPIQALVYATGEEIKAMDYSRQDFTPRELARLVHLKSRNAKALEFAEKFVAEGRQGFIACVPGENTYHARYMATELSKIQITDPKTGQMRSIIARAITGRHSPDARRAILSQFEDGSIDVLTFVQLLGEGWDSDVASFGINTCPTTSIVKITQLIGRLLRKKSVEAIFIDFLDDIIGKEQKTALHALGELKVDLGKVVGPGGYDWPTKIKRITYLRGLLGSKLWSELALLDSKLVKQIGLKAKQTFFHRELHRYNVKLAREGMPEEFPDRLGVHRYSENALEKARQLVLREEDRRGHTLKMEDAIQARPLQNSSQQLILARLLELDNRLDEPVDLTVEPIDPHQLNEMIIHPTLDYTDKIHQIMYNQDVLKALPLLPERDQLVLRMYFGLGGEEKATYAQIADILDLSRGRVGQLVEEASENLLVAFDVTQGKLDTGPRASYIRIKQRDLRMLNLDIADREHYMQSEDLSYTVARQYYQAKIKVTLTEKKIELAQQRSIFDKNFGDLEQLFKNIDPYKYLADISNKTERFEKQIELLKNTAAALETALKVEKWPIDSRDDIEKILADEAAKLGLKAREQ